MLIRSPIEVNDLIIWKIGHQSLGLFLAFNSHNLSIESAFQEESFPLQRLLLIVTSLI